MRKIAFLIPIGLFAACGGGESTTPPAPTPDSVQSDAVVDTTDATTAPPIATTRDRSCARSRLKTISRIAPTARPKSAPREKVR